MKSQDRLFWTIAVLITLALTAIVYAPMFRGKIPFPSDFVFDFPPFAKAGPQGNPVPHTNIGDLATSFYPYRTLAARAVRDGTLPLWNPYMLSGAPFLATAQPAVFYPLNFLYYVLPVPWAWSIGFVLRRVLAMLFTALFVRRIGGSPTGAIISGLLFAFCGFITGWQGQAMSDAAIWLPLICYSVVRLHSEPSGRSIALAGFAFVMPVLAGHPETAAHLTLTGIALAGLLLLGKGWNFRFAKYFTASGLLALGLSAVQVIPTAEWLRYVHHSFPVWPPLPIWSMLTLVSRDIIRSTNSIGLLLPEQAGYLAMLTFIAAPLAFLHSSRRFVIFLALWSAAALSAAYGIGPASWLVEHLPVLKTLKNARLILIFSFGLAALAGLGISALETFGASKSRTQTQRAAMLVLFGLGIGLVLVYAMHVQAHVMATEVVEFVRLPKFSLFLLLASAVPVAWKLLGGLGGRTFQVFVLAVVVVDLSTVTYGAIPFSKPRDVFPSIELFRRIPQNPKSPFRLVNIGIAYGANFEAMYGLSAVGGYEISLERLKTFLKDLSRDEMDSVMLTTKGVLETRDRRIDMLNARYYIVSEWDSRYLEFRKQPDRFRFMFTFEDTDVFENMKALPAAFLVPASGIEIIGDDAEQLQRLKDPGFDPEHHVVLPEMPAAGESPVSVEAKTSGVEWVSRRTNDFELDVAAREPSVLVISQIHYPGWKSYVDDREVAVTRANYALPAVLLPAGLHRVRFSFEPLSFRIGLLLTSAAAVIMVILLGEGRNGNGAQKAQRGHKRHMKFVLLVSFLCFFCSASLLTVR